MAHLPPINTRATTAPTSMASHPSITEQRDAALLVPEEIDIVHTSSEESQTLQTALDRLIMEQHRGRPHRPDGLDRPFELLKPSHISGKPLLPNKDGVLVPKDMTVQEALGLLEKRFPGTEPGKFSHMLLQQDRNAKLHPAISVALHGTRAFRDPRAGGYDSEARRGPTELSILGQERT